VSLPTEVPTEDELKPIRKEWMALIGTLTAAGMQAQIGWPVKRKLMVYLLQATGEPDAQSVNNGQWAAFFQVMKQAVETNVQGLIAVIESALPAETKTLPSVSSDASQSSLPASRTGTALRCLDELVEELKKTSFDTHRAGQILSQLRQRTPRGRWTDMIRVASDRVLKADIPWVHEWLKTYGRRRHPARSMDRLLTKMEFISRRPNAKGASHYPVMPKVAPAKTVMPQVIASSYADFEARERAKMRAAIAAFNAEP
jgi:hypothetical protein